MKRFLICGVMILLSSGCAAAETTLQLLFVGDVMLDEVPGRLVRQGRDPFADFEGLFARADLRIGNLECTVGLPGTGVRQHKPYTFMAHPRVVPLLARHFSAVSLANNHTGDFGPEAFAATMHWLDRSGVRFFGGGHDRQSAHRPVILEAKGYRVAILGYDLFLPRSFEAQEDQPGTAWGEADLIAADIAWAREVAHADLVITYPHWGWEYEKTAAPAQVALAHWMIDHGADAVVGGHPHVTQNVELYRAHPIFYSLGNFVFNGFSTPDTTTGWALLLSVTPGHQIAWEIHEARLDRHGVPHDAGAVEVPVTRSTGDGTGPS